ncbi:hypothetical protein HNQ56_003803 [Anaerotaenia torta]
MISVGKLLLKVVTTVAVASIGIATIVVGIFDPKRR